MIGGDSMEKEKNIYEAVSAHNTFLAELAKMRDMEKEKKKIIYEAVSARNAFLAELAKMGDNNYGIYHSKKADWFSSIGAKFREILGFTGRTMDEFFSHVSTIELTPEQKRALIELRKQPAFKKLMGETALQQKSELEILLESKITDEGMTFADENGAYTVPKLEQQIEHEFEGFDDKLSQLLTDGTITKQQYDDYSQNLDYIFSYYISCSKGEQIPFRKLKNFEYGQILERAQENDISFSEQLFQENQDLMDEHNELQELQSQAKHR